MKIYSVGTICGLLFFICSSSILQAQSKPDKIYLNSDSVITAKVLGIEGKMVVFHHWEQPENIDTVYKFQVAVIVYGTGEFTIFNTDYKVKKVNTAREFQFKVEKGSGREEFHLNKAVLFRVDYGMFGNRYWMQRSSLKPTEQTPLQTSVKRNPIAIGFDFGVSQNFALGPRFMFAGMTHERIFEDSAGTAAAQTVKEEISEGQFFIALQGKIYFTTKGKFFRPYFSGGLNYVFITANDYIWKMKDGDITGSPSSYRDSDIFVDGIARFGFDLMTSSSVGINLEGGWGITFVNGGIIFKF